LEDINVRIVGTLAERFDVVSGLSDHTLDPVTAPAASVALGGRIVEKHFTLDRDMEGPDHGYALEPDELAEMVTAVRNTERALGTGEKRVLDVEQELHRIARRAIHATVDIPEGTELTRENVAVLRPGQQTPGLRPKHLDSVLGRRAVRDIRADEGIQWEHLDGEGVEAEAEAETDGGDGEN
jgi:N-acetylneuraminate synthase